MIKIILYGNSVILGTLGASLGRYPDLEIMTLSPTLEGAEELEALTPDVILFDEDAGRPEAAFVLLKRYANLLLIGINPENEQLFLWSSGQGSVVSTADIVQTIARISKKGSERIIF